MPIESGPCRVGGFCLQSSIADTKQGHLHAYAEWRQSWLLGGSIHWQVYSRKVSPGPAVQESTHLRVGLPSDQSHRVLLWRLATSHHLYGLLVRECLLAISTVRWGAIRPQRRLVQIHLSRFDYVYRSAILDLLLDGWMDGCMTVCMYVMSFLPECGDLMIYICKLNCVSGVNNLKE